LLAQTHFKAAKLTNIDCDLHALKLSNKLASSLGVNDRIKTLHAKAEKIPTIVLAQCDVVYLAALVGMSSSAKSSTLSSVALKMKKGAILLARSAYGLRSLLYPVLGLHSLDMRQLGLELVTEWRPEDDEVVNSVVVFRKISASN
jgi:nicotianamine synthase